jgi:magnesium transporter
VTPGRRLAQAFLESHPRRAAEAVEAAEPAEAAGVLEDCTDEVAAEVLQHVEPFHAGRIVEAMPAARRPKLLAALPPRRAALVLQDAPEKAREAWLAALPGDLAAALRAALAYPDDSAARLMDPAVLAAPAGLTTDEARQLVARHPQRALYYLYVVDDERRPVGVLNLRELICASPRAPLATLMRSPVVTVPARAPAVVVAAHAGWRTLHALPVVDDQGTLVGVLRYETGEEVRGRDHAGPADGGLGVALGEAMLSMTAHLVDEVASALQPKGQKGG